ncbi:hypothetical protein ACWC2T_39375 [Streptomyces sp. NPDC001393]
MYATFALEPQIKRPTIGPAVPLKTLRGWIRQAAPMPMRERGDRPTTFKRGELAALRKQNAQLKRTRCCCGRRRRFLRDAHRPDSNRRATGS